MRRVLGFLLTCLIILNLYAPALSEPKPELTFFFESYCGSCTPEEDFLETFRDLTGKNTSDYACTFYNIRYENARKALDEAITRYNIPKEGQLLPMLIMDGQVYAGQDAISAELPRDVLARENTTDSVVYYLYVTACGSCAEAKKVLDTLPASVSLTRGTYAFESKVEIVPINIGEETALALSLFESYHVPEDKQVAPIVFLRDRYLSGSKQIQRDLFGALARGEAVGNRIIQTEKATLPSLHLLSTMAAGLVGGLNPCALSMVLLLMSILIPLKKRVGRYALLFLASKFICYLAIGTLLTSMLQAFDLNWLPVALKIFLTVYSAVLILLNLWDAYAARREEYGQIRNQLPKRLRRFLHHCIEGTATDTRAMVPAMVLLGALVAASEFLCAGQVYLATLLSSLQSGAQTMRMFLMLMVYCLAFLMPSALLTALVIRGKAVLQVSDWMRRRMTAIKLITALFFLVVLLAVWLL